MDGKCADCGTPTQTIPGPAERGEREYRLARSGMKPGYRWRREDRSDALREVLLCMECFQHWVEVAMKKYDEACET